MSKTDELAASMEPALCRWSKHSIWRLIITDKSLKGARSHWMPWAVLNCDYFIMKLLLLSYLLIFSQSQPHSSLLP